jgi:SAM-dependent methyltransferase
MTAADAYSRTGAAWQGGPGVIYDRLAEVLVQCAPDPLQGVLALDLGAGTGAATRALLARGSKVVALDAAAGMLRAWPDRPAAVVADALALPLRDKTVGAVVAAFSLNHLADPVAGLREAARVAVAGGLVMASAYAEDDTHPAKEAAERAATRAGWVVPDWYREVRAEAVPKLATATRAAAAADAARCHVLLAEQRRVPFPDLGPRALAEWRLGMAQLAPFMATLDATRREAVVADAVDALRGAPPLERSIVLLVARVR